VLVALSFLAGFAVFLASVVFALLARQPEGWPLPEITWRLLLLVAGVGALIFHLFVGFLIGAAFDRMRETK
jgi:uncharacterized membrane protein